MNRRAIRAVSLRDEKILTLDKIQTYRSHIHAQLQRYVAHAPHYGDIETQLIEDTEHDHYQIFSVG